MKNLLFILLLPFTVKAQTLMLGTVEYRVAPLNLIHANIVAAGDSYVSGNGMATPFSTVIHATVPFSTNGSTMHNTGVGGRTVEDVISTFSSEVASTYTGGYSNILLLHVGGNSIYYIGDADSAYHSLHILCDLAHTSGFKVIISTCIPRDQTTAFGDNPTQFNTKLTALNASLIADHSFADGLIRPDLESIFATYTSGGYNADHVHPNQTGQDKYADLYITAINALTE